MGTVDMALKIITDSVKEKRSTGEVPVFLGVHGMLALMHNDIVEFSKLPEDARSKFVLSLAVKAVFALSTILPDMDDMDEVDNILEDEEEKPLQENPETADTDEEADTEDDEDAGRWAPRPNSKPSTAIVDLEKLPPRKRSYRHSEPELKAMTDNDDEDTD